MKWFVLLVGLMLATWANAAAAQGYYVPSYPGYARSPYYHPSPYYGYPGYLRRGPEFGYYRRPYGYGFPRPWYSRRFGGPY
jgi:hypothetical protein